MKRSSMVFLRWKASLKIWMKLQRLPFFLARGPKESLGIEITSSIEVCDGDEIFVHTYTRNVVIEVTCARGLRREMIYPLTT